MKNMPKIYLGNNLIDNARQNTSIDNQKLRASKGTSSKKSRGMEGGTEPGATKRGVRSSEGGGT